jgi:hypothetical protein
MYAAAGGESGRHAINSLIGNLRLKLLCSQDEAETCIFQSELLGKTKRLLYSSSVQPPPGAQFEFWRPRTGVSAGMNESWEYEIQPWDWSHCLRSGGHAHDYTVDAVAFQGGRIWEANGKTYLPIAFQQSKE